MTNEENITHAEKIEFGRFKEMVEKHPACGHEMFVKLAEKARKDGLNSEQIDVFSKAMMARIYRTIPNIAGLVQTALLEGDDALAATAMQNLTEEMSGKKSHKQLAEEAFNALRASYGLPEITLKQAHDAVPLPESYAQETIWERGYKDFPAIASWLQERASGGGDDKQQGMMADIFGVFAACEKQIGKENFKEKILPYFEAHIKIMPTENGGYKAVFDNKGVEHQHGKRAENDALREFAKIMDAQKGKIKTMAQAFLDAQSNLFSSIAQATGIAEQGQGMVYS